MISVSLAALYFAAAVDTSSAAAAGLSEPAPVRTGLGFAGMPLIGFNSDDGLGYGARVALYDYGSGLAPYRYSLVLQLFQTTNHVAAHRVIFDAPKIFGSEWRVGGELRYYADKF